MADAITKLAGGVNEVGILIRHGVLASSIAAGRIAGQDHADVVACNIAPQVNFYNNQRRTGSPSAAGRHLVDRLAGLTMFD